MILKLPKITAKNGGTEPKEFGAFGADTRQDLTPKDKEMLKQLHDVEELYCQGYQRVQVAALLGISERTVVRRLAEIREQNFKIYQEEMGRGHAEKGSAIESMYAYLQRKYLLVYSQAKTDRVKVSVLDSVVNLMDRRVKLMQILGYLPKDGVLEDGDGGNITVVFSRMRRPLRSTQLPKLGQLGNEPHKN